MSSLSAVPLLSCGPVGIVSCLANDHRKLLLGGRGRWRAVDEPLRNGVENPEDYEGGEETDYTGMTIDSDGSTVSKEAVEARVASFEASKAARAAREKAREAERQRATIAKTANTLKAMTAVSLKVSESRASERARPGVVGIRVRSSDRRLIFLPWLAQRCGHDLNLVLPSRCAVLLLPVLPLRLCAAVLRCSVRACVAVCAQGPRDQTGDKDATTSAGDGQHSLGEGADD